MLSARITLESQNTYCTSHHHYVAVDTGPDLLVGLYVTHAFASPNLSKIEHFYVNISVPYIFILIQLIS